MIDVAISTIPITAIRNPKKELRNPRPAIDQANRTAPATTRIVLSLEPIFLVKSTLLPSGFFGVAHPMIDLSCYFASIRENFEARHCKLLKKPGVRSSFRKGDRIR